MKRKTISKPVPTTCDPTDHMFTHVDVTPQPGYNNQLGGIGNYPQSARRVVVYCTKCAATKVIQ